MISSWTGYFFLVVFFTTIFCSFPSLDIGFYSDNRIYPLGKYDLFLNFLQHRDPLYAVKNFPVSSEFAIGESLTQRSKPNKNKRIKDFADSIQGLEELQKLLGDLRKDQILVLSTKSGKKCKIEIYEGLEGAESSVPDPPNYNPVLFFKGNLVHSVPSLLPSHLWKNFVAITDKDSTLHIYFKEVLHHDSTHTITFESKVNFKALNEILEQLKGIQILEVSLKAKSFTIIISVPESAKELTLPASLLRKPAKIELNTSFSWSIKGDKSDVTSESSGKDKPKSDLVSLKGLFERVTEGPLVINSSIPDSGYSKTIQVLLNPEQAAIKVKFLKYIASLNYRLRSKIRRIDFKSSLIELTVNSSFYDDKIEKGSNSITMDTDDDKSIEKNPKIQPSSSSDKDSSKSKTTGNPDPFDRQIEKISEGIQGVNLEDRSEVKWLYEEFELVEEKKPPTTPTTTTPSENTSEGSTFKSNNDNIISEKEKLKRTLVKRVKKNFKESLSDENKIKIVGKDFSTKIGRYASTIVKRNDMFVVYDDTRFLPASFPPSPFSSQITSSNPLDNLRTSAKIYARGIKQKAGEMDVGRLYGMFCGRLSADIDFYFTGFITRGDQAVFLVGTSDPAALNDKFGDNPLASAFIPDKTWEEVPNDLANPLNFENYVATRILDDPNLAREKGG